MKKPYRIASFISLPAIALLLLSGIFLTHCKKFDVERQVILTTDKVEEITHHTVDVTGSMMDLAGIEGKYYGFHWAVAGQQANPLDTIILGKPYNAGQFRATIQNLESGTEYEVWTYVLDKEIEIGAPPIPFKTADPDLPTVEIIFASPLNPNAIWVGYEVIDDGGSPVTKHGICWNLDTEPYPELEPYRTIEGEGTGSFESVAEGLLTETGYSIRPYAISKAGIRYGALWSVNTPNPEIPLIYALPAEEITSTSAILRAITPYLGQSPITQKGICWGPEPDINFGDTFLEWTSEEGTMEFEVSSLTPGTKYYYKGVISWGGITRWTGPVEFETLPE